MSTTHCPTPQKIIDYSNGDQLSGADYTVDGTVLYHMQWPNGSWTHSHLDEMLEGDTPTVPNDSFLLFDTEPWIHGSAGNYYENDWATNMTLWEAYAETQWKYAETLRRRNIVMHIYRAPMWLNFTVAGSSTSSFQRGWTARQEILLTQAKQASLLDALRVSRSGVAIPLYIPNTWVNANQWASNIGRLIDLADKVFDDWGLDHVWMLMPQVAGAEIQDGHLAMVLEKAWYRLAAWGTVGTLGFPKMVDAINELGLPLTLPCQRQARVTITMQPQGGGA